MTSKIEKTDGTTNLTDRLLERSSKVREVAEISASTLGLAAPRKEILVLLLDTSASMGMPCAMCGGAAITGPLPTKLQALQEAIRVLAQKIASRVPPTTCLQAVEFADEACLVPVAGAAQSAGGDTQMVKGMAVAFEVLRKSTGFQAHRAILMSDGQPSCRREAVVAEADRFSKYGFVIDTVAFGSDADVVLLKTVAKATGGIMYEASSVEDLVRSFALLDTPVRGLLR